MIPEPHEYLSFLMGADTIADDELTNLRVRIVKGAGTPFRGLLIPAGSLPAYRALIREKLTRGFWNDILGRHQILFYDDPIEKTSDMPRYLAGNPYYRELIDAFHGHRPTSR